MTKKIFNKIIPSNIGAPLVISAPHVGTYIPPLIQSKMKKSVLLRLEDTDFHVDHLYDFATDMGIPMIASHYSRYVIDLNRSPDNEYLYADGRNTTSLVPTFDFDRNAIYKSPDLLPTESEISERITSYYNPYHAELNEMLRVTKSKYGNVLLLDVHSIRRSIPAISQDSFADIIVGDNDGRSAEKSLSKLALEVLEESDYSIAYNQPFKGGYITRHYGRPSKHIHAIQIEMSKDIYLDHKERTIDTQKSQKLKPVLKSLIEKLIHKLTI